MEAGFAGSHVRASAYGRRSLSYLRGFPRDLEPVILAEAAKCRALQLVDALTRDSELTAHRRE